MTMSSKTIFISMAIGFLIAGVYELFIGYYIPGGLSILFFIIMVWYASILKNEPYTEYHFGYTVSILLLVITMILYAEYGSPIKELPIKTDVEKSIKKEM